MSTTKKVLIGISGVLVTLLALAGLYAVNLYVNVKGAPSHAFSSTPTPTISATPSPEKLPEVVQLMDDSIGEWDDEVDENYSTQVNMNFDPNFMKDKVNILLLGWDQSSERNIKGSALYRDDNNNFRSDVLILLSVDFAKNQVDMVSIPRDTYAKIHETKGKWKINAAFAKGGASEGEGFQYAMSTVSNLFGGIPIDYYAGVDMNGFKALVDAMDGIEYDVDIPIKLNGRVLETGMQNLNGQQVLDYVRARKGIGTDLTRIDRQQRILFAIFDQMKSTGQLLKFPQIYSAIDDMLWTNLNLEQIASLAIFANDLGLDNVNRHVLEGRYMNAYGANFFVLNQRSKSNLVELIFGFKPSFDRDHDASYVSGVMAQRAAAAAPTPAQDEPIDLQDEEDIIVPAASVVVDEETSTQPDVSDNATFDPIEIDEEPDTSTGDLIEIVDDIPLPEVINSDTVPEENLPASETKPDQVNSNKPSEFSAAA